MIITAAKKTGGSEYTLARLHPTPPPEEKEEEEEGRQQRVSGKRGRTQCGPDEVDGIVLGKRAGAGRLQKLRKQWGSPRVSQKENFLLCTLSNPSSFTASLAWCK